MKTLHEPLQSLAGGVTALNVAPKIAFQGVSKLYGGAGRNAIQTLALDNLDIAIRPAEIVTVLGPTGCGKSSTLNIIAGFEQPSTGVVLLDGKPIDGPGPDRAVVFQQPSLFPWLNVFDNVTLGVKCQGKPREDYTARAMHLLAEVGLAGFENHYPWQLSGGMQQRVSIARALAVRPRILVMDEPFASVDAQTRFDLEDLVLKVRADFGITTLMVTHDIDEATYLSDEVVVLYGKPAKVSDVIAVDLPFPRSQVETRNDHRFSALRTRIYEKVRGLN